jgi:hypothetical protein
MLAVFLALALLAALGFGLSWFVRTNPSSLARSIRRLLIGVAVLVVGVVLLFSVRFLPEILPELLGLAGLVATGFLTRWARRWAGGGFNSADTPQRTEVRTAFLRAWIDHGTGDVGGAVMAGRFVGRTLASLSDGDVLDLLGEAAADPDSARVLEAYLDRRLGPEWRRKNTPPPVDRGGMGRAEALAILGLVEGSTEEDVRQAHRRLIQRVHPDVGGTADLAARINRAKDVLLGL